MKLRPATADDIAAIHAVLVANRGDKSLFQQSRRQLTRSLEELIVAVDGDTVVGCAQVHWHTPTNAEILAVAVAPAGHGGGVGTALVREAIARAAGAAMIWLATAKPAYFTRFGFAPTSKFTLPLRALATKIGRVFQQPVRRWIPALFGRHTFMQLASASVRSRASRY